VVQLNFSNEQKEKQLHHKYRGRHDE